MLATRSGMKLEDEKLFRTQCCVDGQWIDADSGGAITVVNPATGREIGSVPRMGAKEALEFGMVGVNVGLMANEAAPFGASPRRL